MIHLHLKFCWVFELKINTAAEMGAVSLGRVEGSVTVATKLAERPGGKDNVGVGKSSVCKFALHY